MPMGIEHAQPSRRALLAHAALWGLGSHAGNSHAATRPAPADAPRVLTAWRDGDQAWAGVWTPGRTPQGVALPARAHQLLALPATADHPAQALVLARRPGKYLLRMDTQRSKALQWHTMEDDRYLGGHAALAADGGRFFTTETDGESGQGLIAERDLHTLEKLREFPSGGIGPHALLLEPDGTLLVANGGILNLPETGRRKLNLAQMDSNLTRLDTRTGSIMAQYRLADPALSLRHLALAPDGTVGIALQAEHAQRQARQAAPALALLQGDTLRAVDWPTPQIPATWDGYAGDVCCANGRFWASASHAGWLASWSTHGSDLQLLALPGAGALAAGQGRWLVGGTKTALFYGSPHAAHAQRYPLTQAWDNHAALLPFAQRPA